MAYDPKYKLKYRPDPIGRLRKRGNLPMPMADDPPEARGVADWDERCRIVYAYMLQLKQGVVPFSRRHGLWFYT